MSCMPTMAPVCMASRQASSSKLLEEWISDLNVGTLGFGAFAELFAGHGGAVDAVASGLGADINYGIAFAGGASVKNLVATNQAEREGIDQRIARVAGLELYFAAEVGNAETVAVRRDAGDDALHHGMVLMDFSLCGGGTVPRLDGAKPRHHTSVFSISLLPTDRAEAQRIHYCYRPCTHGENIAQNSAYAGGCSLKRFDE